MFCPFGVIALTRKTKAPFGWYGSGGIWMIRRNSGGICERKTLFPMKKEADQAGFKGTRTGPKQKHGKLNAGITAIQ